MCHLTPACPVPFLVTPAWTVSSTGSTLNLTRLPWPSHHAVAKSLRSASIADDRFTQPSGASSSGVTPF